MMRPDANVAVFVCVAPVDMRKQAATLALIVEQTLKRNIFEPALYVFSNAQRDRIKIVYWQQERSVSVEQASGRPRALHLPAPHRGRDGDDPRCATRGAARRL